MRRVIDADGFEAKFAADPDPWNYAASPFEVWKRDVLLKACGDRHYGRGLELACANGETTRLLAHHCRRLTAVDASATALEVARRRNAGTARITFRHALLPRDMPRGPFDLIVASEILYYLKPNDLAALLPKLHAALAPGGRIVFLHHVLDFDDAAIRPAQAVAAAERWFAAVAPLQVVRQTGRFRVAAFEKGR
ncbi:methyltransferase domain-containing protein [Aurantimonas aggregata]|uniref:Methyltransferase domain-containing protein n=1 Tax=Aurantimonas aggregata TaxID=2047720 RepID=A0A6L9MG80_9HYPH|nr:class I SAM-dependent methyltransferase [Aurantimonas aggregata]NDV86711.1 methyltransferase domain-containing protein [Aurantimonas aggregata]